MSNNDDRAVFYGMIDEYEPPPGIFAPLDVRGGIPGPWPADEPGLMTLQERRDMAVSQRGMDGPGQDSAWACGLSTVRVPAPKKGWPLDTPREKLTRGVD